MLPPVQGIGRGKLSWDGDQAAFPHICPRSAQAEPEELPRALHVHLICRAPAICSAMLHAMRLGEFLAQPGSNAQVQELRQATTGQEGSGAEPCPAAAGASGSAGGAECCFRGDGAAAARLGGRNLRPASASAGKDAERVLRWGRSFCLADAAWLHAVLRGRPAHELRSCSPRSPSHRCSSMRSAGCASS